MGASRSKKNLWMLYETEVPHTRFCDPACGSSPAEKLRPEHLQLLRNAFTCPKPQACRSDETCRDEAEESGIELKQFKELLRSVIGPSIDDSWAERFYNEVDICCTGQIKWQQLCSYLFLEYTERQRASAPTAALMDVQPDFRHCAHNKREPTVRVVAVFHPPSSLLYVSVSKGGQVAVWNSCLHVLRSVTLAGDPTEEVANTKRFRGWATDAVSMGSCQKVAIATSCRDLHFVHISATSAYEDVHLFGFRSVLTALCYSHDAQCPDKPPLLILGDENGEVHLMWFLKPSKGLFKNPSKKEKGPQRIFFPELSEHSSMVSYGHIPNIHKEPINRVIFEAGSNIVMTSSESDATSVVFTDVSLRKKPQIWKIVQGAKCFDYDSSLELLVTGGCDRKVRLWTRYVTSSPAATLSGHCAGVLDVAIYHPVRQIFSYSRDSELRVWDISSHHCLKTILLQFPCLQTGRLPEHGNFPFLLLSPPLPEEILPNLVVGCKDYLANLTLAEAQQGYGGWLTDERSSPSLSCALYNPSMRQVVTGHTDSSILLWDVETGQKRLRVSNAHGGEGLTCMELDSSHRRLITGAQNGTIKVWNFLNGLNLHKLEPISNSEVTGLTCLRDNLLLAVGWSQCIAQYNIAKTKELKVKADLSWRSRGVHESDIVAIRTCSSLGVVATASYDGELVIWRLETQEPVLHLQRGQGQDKQALPVDVLLFFQYRAANQRLGDKGVLVSSQGGWLCFWSVTGEKHTFGRFYAPEQPGEHVLSLSSDQTKNTLLVSGDTAGCLQIWDISSFALNIQPESTHEEPPLLWRWSAHKSPLVCVEVLDVADQAFILTASTSGSVGLWTKEGDQVGYFGQQVTWSISDPATYHRDQQSMGLKDGTKSGKAGQGEVKGQVSDLTNQSQTHEECCSVATSASYSAENSCEEPQEPVVPCEHAISS